MSALWLLTKRAVRETARNPEATFPLIFIPVFFMLVNAGQLGDKLKGEPFLHGQNYIAFQMPISLLFAVIGITSGLAIIVEIETGYFDKLLVAPISRLAILAGRLSADFFRNLVTGSIVIVIGFAFGMRVESGPLGVVLLVLLGSFFGVAYGSTAVLIALRSRSAQTVNVTSYMFFPLLFLSPNLLPRSLMQGWLRVAARFNPVTYVIEGLRSLILDGWVAERVLMCVVVIAATSFVLLGLSVRAMNQYGDL